MRHLTYQDLLYQLKQLPEHILLELLDISSEELVDRFGDFIENKKEFLFQEFEEEEDDKFR